MRDAISPGSSSLDVSGLLVTARRADDGISQLGPKRIWAFGPRLGDDASRRTFQPRRHGRTHAGTECLVHGEVTGLSVCRAFDFY